ncbi:MAG: FecR domain-containing protein [Bdellovibrionota bacterium]
MSKRRRTAAVVAVLVLLAGAAPSFADPAPSGTGVVTRLEGTAFWSLSQEKDWKPLKLKDTVIEGRYIRTESNSRMEVTLPDGGAVRVAPGTTLYLSKLLFPKDKSSKQFEAKLFVGRLWAKVQAVTGGDSFFKVRTGNAVAGVRGTAFQVNYGGQDATFKCYEGKVAVQAAMQGGTSQVPGGRYEVPGPQQVPGPREVTVEEWTRIVSSWQYVSVNAQGVPSEPKDIDPAADASDSFSMWNRELDNIALPEAEEKKSDDTPVPPAPEAPPAEPAK